MNANRFDTLSKHLSSHFSRRTALRGGSVGLAAVALATIAGSGAAQEATPAAQGAAKLATPAPGSPVHPVVPTKIEYLFTQTFDSGTWKPKAGAKDTYTLTLTGAPGETVYFSDRPERVVGTFPTEKFLDKLGFTPANPPNAALVASPSGGGDQDVLVIELMSPVYDASAGTLTYDAKILTNYEGTGLANLAQQQLDFDFAESFGQGGLFIDGFNCSDGSATCYLVGGGGEVGEINNVGCCSKDLDEQCGLCNDDGTSWYYGMLCNQVYPDQCIYLENGGPDGGPAWGCNAQDLYCPK